MVYVVNGVLASGVDMVLEKDFAGFTLQEMEIHPLMLLIRNDPPNVFAHPPQPQYESYPCELCGNDAHYGYDCPPRVPLYTKIWGASDHAADIRGNASISNQIQIKDYRNERIDIRYRRECEIKIDELKGKFNGMSIEINKKKELRQLEQAANLSTYTTEPSRRFNSFYDDDDYEESTIPLNEIVSQIPSSIAITPVLPTLEPEDSLSIGDEHLSTIPEKESDEFIKYSIEDLCSNTKGKSVTFSNPLFDSNKDFTSSNNESPSDEDVPEDKVKIYSNPLFEFDDEYISSDVNPLFDEVKSKDSYVSNLDEPALLVTPLFDANEDECFDPKGEINEIDAFLDMDISTDFEDDYYDLEGDIIYLESLLIKDTIPNLPPKFAASGRFAADVAAFKKVEDQKPGHLTARLGCAETKVATWDDLAFTFIIFGWNVPDIDKKTKTMPN
ncbi:hypothetical protein Tco_0814248 [Tanacetum coccineum]